MAVRDGGRSGAAWGRVAVSRGGREQARGAAVPAFLGQLDQRVPRKYKGLNPSVM